MSSGLAAGLGKLGLGGAQIAARPAGVGPGPVAIPGYLRYRVLDPVSGAVVIPDLPHSHASRWEVRGMQYGASGSAAIGSFEIPLHAPLSAEYQAAAADYAKLAYGQRIEGYLGDVISGQPKFSGYVRQVPTKLSSYALKGVDSLILLDQAKTYRTEFLTMRSDQLAQRGMQGWIGLNFGDDFSSGSLSGYTQGGAGQSAHPWSATTDEGFTVATASGGPTTAETILLSNASIASYANTISECYLHYRVPARAGAGFVVSGGMVLAAADFNNFWFFQLGLSEDVASGRTAVYPIIWQKSAGVYAAKVTQSPILYLQTASTAATDLRCILQVIGTYAGGTWTWRLLVSGIDVNCTFSFATGSPLSGQIGFRMDGAGGGASQVAGTELVNRALINAFQPGTVQQGQQQIQQVFSRTSSIEFLNIAAVMEPSFAWRKSARAGLYQDTIDFGASPGVAGTDLSASVHFEEGVNLSSPDVTPNAEPLATHVELSMSPGGQNAGYVSWPNIPAIRKYGWLTESIPGPQVADFLTGVRLAQQLSIIRSQPGTAKKFTVLRDELNPDLWRELDFVTVHAPSVQLNNQKVQILSYTWKEGSPEVAIVCDKYPLDQVDMHIRRWQDAIEALTGGHSSLTPSTVGSIFDSMLGSPNVVPFYSGLQTVANGAAAKCRFQIPSFVVGIQKALLSFTSSNVGNHGVTINGVDRTSALGGPFAAGDKGPIDISAYVSGYPAWQEVDVVNNTGAGGDLIIAQVQVYALVKPPVS